MALKIEHIISVVWIVKNDVIAHLHKLTYKDMLKFKKGFCVRNTKIVESTTRLLY
jgi:hypothetical protein